MYKWHFNGDRIIGSSATQPAISLLVTTYRELRESIRSLSREHKLTPADEEWIKDLYWMYLATLPLAERNQAVSSC